MERMAEAAFEAGLARYGFSPHSPICLPSPCNMKKEDVDPYLREAERLRRLYAGRMEIQAGMEIDYISREWGAHLPYFRDMALDYRIGSVHFVPNRKGEYIDCDGSAERFVRNLHERFADDLEYVCRKYFEQVEEMLELGGFDILGHADKIATNACSVEREIEESGWWRETLRRIFNTAASKGITVEINTKAYDQKGRFFPALIHWDLLRESGAETAIHSDAHYPERILSGIEAAKKEWEAEPLQKKEC